MEAEDPESREGAPGPSPTARGSIQTPAIVAGAGAAFAAILPWDFAGLASIFFEGAGAGAGRAVGAGAGERAATAGAGAEEGVDTTSRETLPTAEGSTLP